MPNCMPNKKIRAPLKSISTDIGIDITGPLTATLSGNKYIIDAIDYFSKNVEAEALQNFTAFTAKFNCQLN
jgi:hypothetical protein